MLTFLIINSAAVGGHALLESQPKLGLIPQRRAGLGEAGFGRSAGSGADRNRDNWREHRSTSCYTDFMIL